MAGDWSCVCAPKGHGLAPRLPPIVNTVERELLRNVNRSQEETLRSLLEEAEIEALEQRIANILEKPAFVYPGPYRSVPWPWY